MPAELANLMMPTCAKSPCGANPLPLLPGNIPWRTFRDAADYATESALNTPRRTLGIRCRRAKKLTR